MTERVTVTSDAELEVDPAVMIVGPCTVLVLEDVDSGVYRECNEFRSTLNIRKTTDEVGCLNTLMNSLNEVISVHFCVKSN